MKKSNNISLVKVGMSRDTSYDMLQKQIYTFAMNMNVESESGDLFKLKSEHSNILASKFKSGYKVNGVETNRFNGDTYFFLVNPDTKISEFGVIKNMSNITSIEDVELDCKDCEYKNILATPLENTTQVETQTYTTLLEDGSCGSLDENKLCLNLDINFPIKKIVIKNEQSGVKIFFSDNLNPPRFIDLSKIDTYKTEGTLICGTDTRVATCLDCDKLRMFPIYEPLRIKPDVLVLGGNLPLGSNSFYAAYSDKLGNELSEYTSLTLPIDIFDNNNRITNDTEALVKTAYAIKLAVTNIDTKFSYYKIVVAQKNVIDGGVRYFEVGMFPTTVSSVLFTTEVGKKEITLNDILLPNPNIKLLQGVTESNNYLFGYGITTEKEWNLQPVVNLLGGFFKWQTHISSEDLYANGVNTAKYKEFMRDEVYPLAIGFSTNEGYKTARFPLVAPPPTAEALETVTGTDVDSISSSKGACDEVARSKRWEIYNTAREIDKYSLEGVASNTVSEQLIKVCTLKNVAPNLNTVAGGFTVYDIEEFTSAIDFIEDNPNCGSLYDFCQYTDPALYEECLPDFNDTIVKAGRFVVGKSYKILDPGTTSFMIIGAVNNLADTIFTATGVGTGTGTALLQNCSTPQLDSESIKVDSILGLETNYIEYIFPEEYPTLKGSTACDAFKRDETGTFQRDQEFSEAYINNCCTDDDVWVRSGAYGNTSVAAADKIEVVYDTTNPLGLCYTHNFYGGTTDIESIQFTQFTTVADSANKFSDKVHRESLWFYADIDALKDSILEVTKLLKTNSYNSSDHVSPGPVKFRISVFDKRLGGAALYSKVISVKEDTKLKIHFTTPIPTDIDAGSLVKGETYTIVTTGTTNFMLAGASNNNIGTTFIASGTTTGDGTAELQNLILQDDEGSTPIIVKTDSRKLYVAIDAGYRQTSNSNATEPVGTYYIIAPQFGYSVGLQKIQYDRIEVSYEGLMLDKFQRYTSDCEFEIPLVDSCSAVPFAYGEFGYWESLENYPDNPELYDSSNLVINHTNFSTLELQNEFKFKYSSGLDSEGNYMLTDATNFICKPIRHYKFPDNKVSAFISKNQLPSFSDAAIFPLGVTVDETVINAFLDIAVVNKLITQEQRDSIVEYEIFRGDRTLSRSVLAKGLLYDMYKYTEEDKEIHFANFPYNDLGDNKLYTQNEDSSIYLKHPFDGEYNHNFMFHSPDTEYYKPTLPSELKVEGYAFGNSKGVFNEVKEHPKYVILGRDAKKLASTLATLEVVAEATVIAAQSAEVFRIQFGLANSVNIPGMILNIISVAANIIGAAIFKYGRYKYEWLQTFRNLGNPENFAQYYASVGNYNYIQAYQEEGNLIRGINKSNYLKSGRFTITNEVGAEKIEVNHIDRERGVFLTLGSGYPIVYPETYVSYDNSNLSGGLSSRFVASQTNQCAKGKSKEFIKNIASPYVSLKTYMPSQYGRLDNINWLTTSHRGDLRYPRTIETNLGIFGGDTYITRHTLKRKIPLFLDSAMGLASLTPFAYQSYSNLGTGVKYYANFSSPKDVTLDRGFPDLSTEYAFDCLTGDRDFYVKRPSKFYLYYYGIVSFLTESTINTNFRVGKTTSKEQFYPLIEDYSEWTQETNVSIREDNRYYYSNAYSGSTMISIGRTLPYTYEKAIYDTLYDSPNGVIYSLQDSTEKELTEPWLIFKPLDKYEFPTSYGKLVELRGVESAQVLGRFESTTAVFNALDTMVDGINPNTSQLGTGGIFRKRPITFSSTGLGYAGTQSFQMVSTEFGHFSADAKRGQIFQAVFSGDKPSLKEISSDVDGKGVGMRNWFKEHLPFKILDKAVANYERIDIDNPYNGVGISMGWDSRYKRIFLTKKDYKPLQDVCFKDNKYYIAEDQDIIDARELAGWTYEGVENCEMKFTKGGETAFSGALGSAITCPEGYTYNPGTLKCEKYVELTPQCPEGYTFNQTTDLCELIEIEDAYCYCDADVIPMPTFLTINAGDTVNISLTSTEPGVTFTWTVSNVGVTGAAAGSGNSISQILYGEGNVIYTVTPTLDGCVGPSVEVPVEVICVADAIATPSSLDISDGDTVIINLTSTYPGVIFTWTVVSNGVTGPSAGSGSTISQVVSGEGTSVYTITPSLGGCVGDPIDVVVNVTTAYIPCGGTLNANGNEGVYEVSAELGNEVGITTITFNSINVPDRFQIIWDGNIVADSLFVGDGLPSAGYTATITDLTVMDRFIWNGTSFIPDTITPTEAVTFTTADIAISTNTRAIGTVGQIGVVTDYPSSSSKSSDGNIKLRFNKTLAEPTSILIKVFGIINTGWTISNLECPTEVLDCTVTGIAEEVVPGVILPTTTTTTTTEAPTTTTTTII